MKSIVNAQRSVVAELRKLADEIDREAQKASDRQREYWRTKQRNYRARRAKKQEC